MRFKGTRPTRTPKGPYELSQLSGLPEGTLVWKEGTSAWLPLKEVIAREGAAVEGVEQAQVAGGAQPAQQDQAAGGALKMTPFAKHKAEAEAKRRRTEEENSAFMQEFVASYEAEQQAKPRAPGFVHGGTTGTMSKQPQRKQQQQQQQQQAVSQHQPPPQQQEAPLQQYVQEQQAPAQQHFAQQQHGPPPQQVPPQQQYAQQQQQQLYAHPPPPQQQQYAQPQMQAQHTQPPQQLAPLIPPMHQPPPMPPAPLQQQQMYGQHAQPTYAQQQPVAQTLPAQPYVAVQQQPMFSALPPQLQPQPQAPQQPQPMTLSTMPPQHGMPPPAMPPPSTAPPPMGLPAMPPPSTAPPGMAPTGATDIAQVHATAPSNVERSIHGQPPSGGAGGRGTGKRKAIDDFLDEIKSKQSRREPPSAPRGSHNDGYYKSTNNVFLGNIDPALNEQSIGKALALFGDVASVKIMWPRNEVEKMRNHGTLCGFVAFMEPSGAQACYEALMGNRLGNHKCKVDWGKPVLKVPEQPMYRQASALAPGGIAGAALVGGDRSVAGAKPAPAPAPAVAPGIAPVPALMAAQAAAPHMAAPRTESTQENHGETEAAATGRWLRATLREATMESTSVKGVMSAALGAAEHAEAVASAICEAMGAGAVQGEGADTGVNLEATMSGVVALYVANDILFNVRKGTGLVSHEDSIRQAMVKGLPAAVARLGVAIAAAAAEMGRSVTEQLRSRAMRVLVEWSTWFLFPSDTLAEMERALQSGAKGVFA